MKRNSKIFSTSILIICLTFLTACISANDSLIENTDVGIAQATDPPPSVKIGEERKEKPIESAKGNLPIETPERAPLSATGPWFVVANEEGLYAFNMNGSGLTLLTRDLIHSYKSLSSGVGDQGGCVAYLTATDVYQDLVLHIIDMGNGLDHKTIPLTSEDTDLEGDPENEWDNFELARAIVEVGSYRWSHSGEMLAFFAGIDGPTSDLYVYTPATEEITRLTSGPSQGYRPSWSPDDQYIAHTGASAFGTGAGYSMEGVWAAKVDGSRVVSFPFTGMASDVWFIGWKDNDNFLSAYWNPRDGNTHLKFNDIISGESEGVWEYPFTMADMGSQEFPRIIIGIDDYSSTENPEGLLGVYTLDPPNFQPNLLFDAGPLSVSYIKNGQFLVKSSEGTHLIGRFDALDISTLEGEPIFSNEGKMAWFGYKGLFLDKDEVFAQIVDEPIEHAVWGADSESILFATKDTLYVTTAPEWKPILVAAMFPTDEIVLVMP